MLIYNSPGPSSDICSKRKVDYVKAVRKNVKKGYKSTGVRKQRRYSRKSVGVEVTKKRRSKIQRKNKISKRNSKKNSKKISKKNVKFLEGLGLKLKPNH